MSLAPRILSSLPSSFVTAKNLPFIIFVTAHDQYAIKAFEINALDYLLKPFDDDRFYNSINRAIEYIRAKKNYKSEIFHLLENFKEKQKYCNRILIKTGGRYLLLKTNDIHYIEAAADYARVFTGKKESFLIRDTMNSIEKALNRALSSFHERIFTFSHLSHVYSTGSSIYTTYVFRLADTPEKTLERWRALKQAASLAIVDAGGTISHHHGIGMDHKPYLEVEKESIGINTLHQVFSYLDPEQRMNPDKLLPR